MKKSATSSHGANRALERVNVLIMDSNPKLAELYKNIFLQLGFTHVFTANDGMQGVQLLREMKIDLIVSDWELKVFLKDQETANENAPQTKVMSLSGLQFVRSLRASPSSPNPFIPIIMMTEQVTGGQIMDAINAGVNEIVVKPLKAEDLCGRMKAVIDKPRAFITATAYKGPCRRRRNAPPPADTQERRKTEVRIVKYSESKKQQLWK